MMRKTTKKSEVMVQEFDAAAYLKLPYSRMIVPEDDGTFRAEILEFPGCIATGDSEEEAVRALREVALSWLEAVVASGQAIPEPAQQNEYSGKFLLRLPKSLHRKAALAAERDNVSLNSFIVTSVAEQIGARATGKAPSSAQVVIYPMTVMVSSHDSRDLGRPSISNASQFERVGCFVGGQSMPSPFKLMNVGHYGD